MEEISNINDIINFDFKEGLINSFCKKDVSVLFKPINRYLVKMKVKIYATEYRYSKVLKKNNTKDKLSTGNQDRKNSKEKEINQNENKVEEQKIKSLKCELLIIANGD